MRPTWIPTWPVNWQRARAIRQAADVLVAVLTQQKYNDAAVKQFFRAAVEADKPIIVVFNQCELEADRDYWPQWLATFCEQTGARPELVYVVPYDRAGGRGVAACRSIAGWTARAFAIARAFRSRPKPTSATIWPQLHFDAIKIRTFRGAIGRVLDPRARPAGLFGIDPRGGRRVLRGRRRLSATEMARVGWPSLPAGVLVDEIRDWWDELAARLVAADSRFLSHAWAAASPGRCGRPGTPLAGPPPDPHGRVPTAGSGRPIVLGRRKTARRVGPAGPGGQRHAAAAIAAAVGRPRPGDAAWPACKRPTKTCPPWTNDYRAFLRAELDAWRQSNPRAVRFLQSLDHAAAIARPAITVALFFTGLHFAGDLVGQAAVQAASTTAGHLATEAAIAGGITGGGEALVSSTSEGVRQAAGRLFVRLQSRYAQQRAGWLAEWLERELLGDLLADLRRGAEVPQGAAFREVEAVAAERSTPDGRLTEKLDPSAEACPDNSAHVHLDAVRGLGGVEVFSGGLAVLTLIFTLVMGVRGVSGRRASAADRAASIPLMLPEMLGIAIPVAMLYSVSSVFGRMTGANEMVALKSLGISPMAVVWPVLVLAAFLSLGTVWMYEMAATWGRPSFKRILCESIEDIAYSRLKRKARAIGECSPPPSNASRRTGRQTILVQPTITLKAQPGRPKVTITAAEAELHQTKSETLDRMPRWRGRRGRVGAEVLPR